MGGGLRAGAPRARAAARVRRRTQRRPRRRSSGRSSSGGRRPRRRTLRRSSDRPSRSHRSCRLPLHRRRRRGTSCRTPRSRTGPRQLRGDALEAVEARDVCRGGVREPGEAQVELSETALAARELEQIEPRRASRVLAAPPRVDRRHVGGDRRRELPEALGPVSRDGVDDVDLLAAHSVEDAVWLGDIVPAPAQRCDRRRCRRHDEERSDRDGRGEDDAHRHSLTQVRENDLWPRPTGSTSSRWRSSSLRGTSSPSGSATRRSSS